MRLFDQGCLQVQTNNSHISLVKKCLFVIQFHAPQKGLDQGSDGAHELVGGGATSTNATAAVQRSKVRGSDIGGAILKRFQLTNNVMHGVNNQLLIDVTAESVTEAAS